MKRQGAGRGNELAFLEGNRTKRFTLLDQLQHLRLILFGPSKEKEVSFRKVFELLASASGSHVVRKEGGWLYAGMKKRYELYPGDECDGRYDR